ncbi:MAG: REP-associated tyrosine transposase [Gaiellaceae bacterium]
MRELWLGHAWLVGRRPRIYDPDGLYHVTTHGIEEAPIFRDDVDRQDFCIRFRRAVDSERWEVHAACLMDTHYHFLIGPTLGRVSGGMKALNGGYARAFNKRHGRRGALFQSRYSDSTIRDEEHFRNAVAYIEQNPLAAGMVTELTEWIWTTATPGSPLCRTPPPRSGPAAAVRKRV